jgi:pimeloyl-ACP methyl ester carboxylesterase
MTPVECAEAGQYSIEHLSHMLDHCRTGEGANLAYDPAKARTLFDSLRRNHTWQCPTLITAEAGALAREDRFAKDPRAAKYFGPQLLSRTGFDQTGRDWEGALAYWRQERQLMKEMVTFGGIEFLAGTDTPVERNVPGFALHDELRCLVDAGLTPMQALQAATRNPARFLGKEAEMGTVETGKLADVVLLSADPLADIGNTTKIDAVVADGRLYRRAELDALLADVEWVAKDEREVKLPPPVAADGTRSGLLDLGGGDGIFYEVRGERGPTVVFLHDGLLHRETWNAVWVELPKRYRVVRYDRRGYGLSLPPTRAYSDVDDLRALFDHLKIDKATLVGCSAGGSLAINFALQHPAAVERLVLVGAVVTGMPFSEQFNQRNAAAFAPLRSEGDVSKTIENWVADPYFVSARNAEAKATLARLLRDNPHDLSNERDHWRSATAGEPALRRLGEIRVPTLILVGEGDIPDVHAQAGAIQAGIPDSRRVVVPASGHLVYLERSEQFRQELDSFLAK